MPEFATAVVAAIGAEVGGTVGATLIMNASAIGTTIVTATAVIGSSVYSASQARRLREQARGQYNAAQVDRLTNVVTSVSPRDLVLGRVRKGGTVVFRGSTGTNKTTFGVILALAAHEIDAIEQVYFNDVPIEIDASARVTTAPYAREQTVASSGQATIPAGSTSVDTGLPSLVNAFAAYLDPTTGQDQLVDVSIAGGVISIAAAQEVDLAVTYTYRNTNYFAQVWWDLGTATTADPTFVSLFPDQLTAEHKAQGVAKLFAVFTYDETAFPSGIPNITVRLRGSKVYDPRDGTTAWSDNPALLARHVYQHPYFGKAAVSADEDTRFTAAANACDTAQDWTVDGVTTAGVLYRAGLVAPFGTAARSLLDDLCQAMAGMWAFAGGELYIRAGVYTAPVMTLTDADLAVIQRVGEQENQEAISITPHREQAQKFNTVNVRIWDEEQAYKQVPLTPVVGSALVTRDGKSLAQEVTLAACTYAPQAQHVAGVMMRDARDPLTFEAPWKLKAWPLELFDTVSVTLARYGWSAKTFVVLKREWDRSRGVVKLTMKETAAAIYTPDATFLPQGYAENTALPNPWDIEPPGSLAARSTTEDLAVSPSGGIVTRVRVTWAPVQDSSVTDGGQVEVQWTPIGTDQWQSVTAPGSDTELFLVGPADGTVITIHARARSKLASSDWGPLVAHLVVGQTERPDAVTGLAVIASNGFAVVTWNRQAALDVLYGGQVVIRHSPLTSGATWEDGYVLETFAGNVVQGVVPLMSGTYMAKARDRSGNWSSATTVFVATEGMVTGFTTLTTSTQDPTFTGSKSSLVATDSILKLDSVTLIDDMLTPVDSWGTIDLMGGFASSGEYQFDATVDLTTAAVRRFEVRLKVVAYDGDDSIDARSQPVDQWDAIDGDEINTCDVTVYARTTNDDPAGAPTWSAWAPFMVADFNCRAAQFKAVLTSEFPTHNINVEQLRVAVKEAA
jgi:hypothetical protein